MKPNFNPADTHKVIIVNILDYVYELDTKLFDKFKEPPTGFYVGTQVEPAVMLDSNLRVDKIYIKSTDGGLTEVTGDISELKDTIYSEDGRVLINSRVMANKDKLLAHYPQLPYRAVRIATLFAKHTLCDLIGEETTEITEELRAEFIEMTDKDFDNLFWSPVKASVSACLRDLRECVVSLVGFDVNNLYKIELENTSLSLLKGPDRRIVFYEDNIRRNVASCNSAKVSLRIDVKEIDARDLKRIRKVFEEMGLAPDYTLEDV